MLSLLTLGHFTQAQTLVVNTPLQFGTVVITDNTSVSSLTMTRNGLTSTTNSLFVSQLGTAGDYSIIGAPPFTELSLSPTLPVTSATPFTGTQQFTLTAVDIPTTVLTDASGQATFLLGGTLQTSGTGSAYLNPANYSITLFIEVTY